MWASIVLVFILTQVLLFSKSFWKNLRRQRECQESGRRLIPEFGRLGMLAEMIKAATIYFYTPSYEASFNVAKKYGTISIGRFGDVIPFNPHVIINSTDLETCKKVMKSPKWPDKFPHDHYIYICSFNKPLGLLSAGGEYYKRARQLSFKLLHDFGFFNPSRMEGLVSLEMAETEKKLKKRIDAAGGELTCTPHRMFQVSTLNMVWQMLMGQRFSYSDPMVHEMIHCVNESNRKFYAPYTIIEVFPFLKKFPRLTFLGAWQDCCEFMEISRYKKICAYKTARLLERD